MAAAWTSDGASLAGTSDEEDEEADAVVHHVWYIRTKGLDECAIAAIAAVVYDAKKRGAGACGHAFHCGYIDTWLRAHVNCPLCRAPVQVIAAVTNSNTAPGAATATPGDEPKGNPGTVGGVQTEETAGAGEPERTVRRAALMVALLRRAWPDVSFWAPASSSGREEDMTGLGKLMRLLKLSDALEISFSAGSCQRLPTRSAPSAAGVSSDEMPQ
ncbi:hypothetical protein BAE44_0024039 [Dichanthelium oligosanthes]|uniref:RING-type E3 ubiquitin transferase n=1 Tax=Dichanthelium oligosanthes TaxID=888268 RepID=A0A1E5UPW7_9POAL|nr:hypothetical protein BAE44_0024039 [Dichanthelium oligosanthes]